LETSPGAHNLTYWSQDLAGNEEVPSTFWFVVDGDSPVTTISFRGANLTVGDKVYIPLQTGIMLNATDRTSGVNRIECNIDNLGHFTYAGQLTFNSPGGHLIAYRAVDNVGNTETEKSIHLIVDGTAPVTKSDAPTKVINRTVTIAFNATDSGSGIAGTFYRLYTGVEKPGDYRTGTELVIEAADDHSADGNYTVQYYSVDNVGNAENVHTLVMRIDTLVYYDLGFSGELKVSNPTYLLQGKTEPQSEVMINGKDVLVSADGSFSDSVDLREGRNKLTVLITDPAGNTVNKTIFITYTPPLTISTVILVVIVLVTIVMLAIIVVFRRTGKKKASVVKEPRLDD
jgi:hypothetical protein